MLGEPGEGGGGPRPEQFLGHPGDFPGCRMVEQGSPSETQLEREKRSDFRYFNKIRGWAIHYFPWAAITKQHELQTTGRYSLCSG